MQLQKREPQKQELTKRPIGEKEKFELAKQSQKIGDSGEEAIRQALRYAMVKIGLRGANFPHGAEKVLLIRHVHENFPDNTVEEIKIAFDWAISGRLEIDYNCFENFSCAYFSKIMNAYNWLANFIKPNHAEQKAPPENLVGDDRREYDWDEFLQSDFMKKLRKAGIKLPGE